MSTQAKAIVGWKPGVQPPRRLLCICARAATSAGCVLACEEAQPRLLLHHRHLDVLAAALNHLRGAEAARGSRAQLRWSASHAPGRQGRKRTPIPAPLRPAGAAQLPKSPPLSAHAARASGCRARWSPHSSSPGTRCGEGRQGGRVGGWHVAHGVSRGEVPGTYGEHVEPEGELRLPAMAD